MKEYTPDEILRYAKRVVNRPKNRLAAVICGGLLLTLNIMLIWMLYDKSQAMQTTLILDLKFLAGVAFGLMFTMFAALSGISLVIGFGVKLGVNYHALKRLIELEEKESGQLSCSL